MKWLWALPLVVALAVAQTQPARTPAKKSAPAKKEAPPPQAAPANKWPIQKLVVEGNHAYTAEQVIAASGLKIGDLAGKTEFDAARDRLVATGVFETVGYKFEPGPDKLGYIATLQVTEVE